MRKVLLIVMMMLMLSISVNAQSLNTALVSFYNFDIGDYNTTHIYDELGKHNATLVGATTNNSGIINQAQYNYYSNTGNNILNNGSGNWTISAWYKPNTTGTFSPFGTIATIYDCSLYMNLGGVGITRFQVNGSTGGQPSYTNSTHTSVGVWHHYVVQRYLSGAGYNYDVYYNGSLYTSGYIAGTGKGCANSGNSITMGGAFGGSGAVSVDAFGVWERKLNTTEITELYNNGTGKQYPFAATSSYFDVTALNNYTAGSITSFNASINGTFYNTSNGTINTNLTGSSLVNVSVNATNYFPETYLNINISADLVANLTPYTAIYANSLVSGNISISSFSLNVTNSSGTTTYTTTNGVIYVPLFNATWNFTLFDAFNATYNFTSDNTSLTGNPYLQEYRFYLYASNTFNIIFRDELNNSIIYTPSGNSSLIQVEFIGDAFSYNFTANGTLTAELLIPQDYIIRYQKDGYGRLRQYFVTLTNQTVQNLTLYMLLDSESEDLTVTAYEQTTLVRVPGSVVYLQRFNVSTNSYSTVAMYETDVAGNAYFDAQRNDELYKFQVDYPWGTSKFVSEAFYIESSEINLYISTIPGFTEGFFEQSGIQGTITYSSSPNTFTLSYSDSSNTATQYCFSIKQWNRYAKEIINQSCSSSASGSMSLTGFTEDGTYYGVFTATIDGTEQVIAASWKDLITDELNAGAFGILLTLGIFLTIIFVFPWHTYAAILGSVGLIFARLFGIFPIDRGYIIAILIASILLGALLENRR